MQPLSNATCVSVNVGFVPPQSLTHVDYLYLEQKARTSHILWAGNQVLQRGRIFLFVDRNCNQNNCCNCTRNRRLILLIFLQTHWHFQHRGTCVWHNAGRDEQETGRKTGDELGHQPGLEVGQLLRKEWASARQRGRERERGRIQRWWTLPPRLRTGAGGVLPQSEIFPWLCFGFCRRFHGLFIGSPARVLHLFTWHIVTLDTDDDGSLSALPDKYLINTNTTLTGKRELGWEGRRSPQRRSLGLRWPRPGHVQPYIRK